MSESVQKLDIGCGRSKVPGAVGLDCVEDTEADIVCDLAKTPWPVEPNSFDEIHAYNIVEHLPNLPAIMEEIHRVGRHGATVKIRTPHFASLASWEDPTHLNHFSLESFEYFCNSTRHVQHYTRCRFKMERMKLHFGGHPLSLLGRFIFWLSPRQYEKYWAFILRPSTLEIEMRVMKSGEVSSNRD